MAAPIGLAALRFLASGPGATALRAALSPAGRALLRSSANNPDARVRQAGATLTAKIVHDGLPDFYRDLALLLDHEVLVGVPEAETERDDPDSPPGITNATIAYIQDNGAPEQGIPARPFMVPGITRVEDKLALALYSGVKHLGTPARKNQTALAVEAALTRAGLIASTSIKLVINQGIPPPLSERTLRKRAAKGRKGAAKELQRRAEGLGSSTQFAKPLIDTGELRNAITYVIASKATR